MSLRLSRYGEARPLPGPVNNLIMVKDNTYVSTNTARVTKPEGSP